MFTMFKYDEIDPLGGKHDDMYAHKGRFPPVYNSFLCKFMNHVPFPERLGFSSIRFLASIDRHLGNTLKILEG